MPPKKENTKGKAGAKKAAPKSPPAIVITLTLPHASTPERTGTMMITRGSLGTMRQFTYRNPGDLAEVIRAGVLGLNKIEMQPHVKAAKPAPKAETPVGPPASAAAVETPPNQVEQDAAAMPQPAEPPPEQAAVPPVTQTPAVPTPTTPTPPTPAAPPAPVDAVPVTPSQPEVANPPAPVIEVPAPALDKTLEAPTAPVVTTSAPAVVEAPSAPPSPPAVTSVDSASAAVPVSEPDYKHEDDFADDNEADEFVSDIDPTDPFWATAEHYAELAAQREVSGSPQTASPNGAAQPGLF